MRKGEEDLIAEGIIQELRRGAITLAILSQLKEPHYGYGLVSLMKEKGFNIEANTLYPLLRRLENQGILESLWDTEGSKARKYYRISEFGQAIYLKLWEAWQDMNKVINILVEGEAGDD